MIFVPDNLPLIERLRAEGLPLQGWSSARDSHPLRILFLNLMPDKEACEAEIYRALAVSGEDIFITLVKMSNLSYKDSPQAYMDTYYQDIAEVMEEGDEYDGLIINGAPLQRFEFEEVRYWPQLKVFFRWSDSHVHSAFYICWGAFARLYYNWGIHFRRNSFQWSGVYPHTILNATSPYVDGTQPHVLIPVSRPWYIDDADVALHPEVQNVAHSPVTGSGLLTSHGGRQVFSVSHFEYEPQRLDAEYHRDSERGLDPMVPYNYYRDDDPSQPPIYSWEHDRDVLYTTWVRLLVQLR